MCTALRQISRMLSVMLPKCSLGSLCVNTACEALYCYSLSSIALLQVYGQQTRLQKYCKFFRKQHTIDKFDSVINQLDEHSEKAWQLANNNAMPMRRRGMRASFSQGLQTSSFVGPTDSNVFDSAECAGKAAAAAMSPVSWYCQCVRAMVCCITV